VIADIHPQNARSVRVAENIGFVFRGRRFHHGEPHLHYAMTVAEYRAVGGQA
jgi:RimJ/RimL family protein N-acetyltransferase